MTLLASLLTIPSYKINVEEMSYNYGKLWDYYLFPLNTTKKEVYTSFYLYILCKSESSNRSFSF